MDLERQSAKQGDPISPILFNAVVDKLMSKLKERWSARRYGVQLGSLPTSSLTNLQFADDVLLIERTLPQIRAMLSGVAWVAAKVGLELHPGKTKYLVTLWDTDLASPKPTGMGWRLKRLVAQNT